MLVLELFITFFTIGICTFGGGYAMLPFIQEEVLRHGWLTQAEVVDFVAVSESTPGPFAINMATYVGIETAGPLGAVAATLGVVLPSFLIIILVTKCYDRFRKAKAVNAALTGIRPVVVGLIGTALLTVGKSAFPFESVNWAQFVSYSFLSKVVIFAVLAFLMIKKVKPVKVIALSAGLGIAAGYLGELLKQVFG